MLGAAIADTQTTNIRITNQTEGGNSNQWGTIADANFEEIDDKFGDVTSISTTGGNTTLSDSQEIVNAIRVSGTLVSNAVIIFSGRGGSWIVENNTTGSFTVTCKVSGQTGVTIEQGGAALVFCNGTDIDYGNPASSATAEVTVASASTCDILGAASEYVAISGTTTVTSFGTGANKVRFARATGAFKITHHATSLICPGGYDITATAGDTFLVVSDASSNVRIWAYQRSAFAPSTTLFGEIKDYAGDTAPTGWLLCYGQAVSRTTYAGLFNAIGVIYGVGNGTTTFNLPDCRDRTRFGKGNMGGVSADRLTGGVSGGIDGDTLGAVGGAESHVITQAQLPNVNLSAGSLSATSTTTVTISNGTSVVRGTGATLASGTGTTSWSGATISATADTTTSISGNVPLGGSATPHNILPPGIVFNTIIFAGV